MGGVTTREIRSHGERQGFLLVDLGTEDSAPLALSERKLGPRVGKYHVDLNSLTTLGVRALKHARESSDIVVCDEVGPMELYSPEFRRAVVDSILNTSKPCLCVVHKRLQDPLIDQLKSSPEAKTFDVTFENREEIPELVVDEIMDLLEGRTAHVVRRDTASS